MSLEQLQLDQTRVSDAHGKATAAGKKEHGSLMGLICSSWTARPPASLGRRRNLRRQAVGRQGAIYWCCGLDAWPAAASGQPCGHRQGVVLVLAAVQGPLAAGTLRLPVVLWGYHQCRPLGLGEQDTEPRVAGKAEEWSMLCMLLEMSSSP